MDTIETITEAILRGDRFYKSVRLTSPQRTGTFMQQSFYAKMEARKLFESHFKTNSYGTDQKQPNRVFK